MKSQSIRYTHAPDHEVEASSLLELIEKRADGDYGRAAYTFLHDGENETSSLTFRELLSKAQSIAAQMMKKGTAGDRAVLLYPPGLEFLPAFFACICSNVIAVPAYPPHRNRNRQRLQSIIRSAQPRFILTTSALLPKISSGAADLGQIEECEFIATDLPGSEDEKWIKSYQRPRIEPETIAFLQYTSGSTGDAKGVILTHSNLLHNAALVHGAVEHGPRDSYVSWLPVFHDMGFMAGVLQPMYAGIPCVQMSPAAFLERPLNWLKTISKYRATTSGGPNFAYDLCASKVTASDREKIDLSSWSVAFNGAEPVRHQTMKHFAQVFAECGFREEVFYPCYGLAEATLMVSGSWKHRRSTMARLERESLQKHRVKRSGKETSSVVVSCGRILSGLKVRIVDSDTRRTCAPNEVGEIWVQGASVASGYWNQREKSSETFAAELDSAAEGQFLRTGDLGFVEDGELFVTGRLKDVIIIRGQNHYPQDIEYTVENAHPSLHASGGAVFSIEVDDQERLVIVQELVTRRDMNLDEILESIRRRVSVFHELTPYAVILIRAGTIPKTSSGKIQRRACQAAFLGKGLHVIAEWHEPEHSSGSSEAAIGPLATADRLSLREWLVTEILHRNDRESTHVDVHTPINACGLDSLTAISIAHKLEVDFGLEVKAAELFDGVTIEEIVQMAETVMPVRSASEPAAIEQSWFPLSHGQRALWYLQQVAPDSAAYHISRAARIRSAVDLELFGQSFQLLVDRHPALRSRFGLFEGEILQCPVAEASADIRQLDATSWSETELNEMLVRESSIPFDMFQGPLLRVRVYGRAEHEHVLQIVVHHIVCDFWSLMVMVHELGLLYEALVQKRAAQLTALQTTYSDFVLWQERELAGPEGRRMWSYWSQKLAGEILPLTLPLDHVRPALRSFRGGSLPFELGRELTLKLKQLSLAYRCTIFVTLLAAFQLLLHRITKQRKIVVGSPTAGRQRPEFAGTVGYFVNPLPFLASFEKSVSFASFLEEVRETVLEASFHDLYPFSLMIERIRTERDLSSSPIFQAMFVFHQTAGGYADDFAQFASGAAGAQMTLGDLHVESVSVEEDTAQFDLTLTLGKGSEGLAGSWQFNTDVLQASTVARWAKIFERLLHGIAESPATKVERLPLLQPSEEEQLLKEWNRTSRDYSRAKLVHNLIEEQAERHPDAVAVVFDETQLTCTQLNSRANQLAHYLRELGAGPEIPVGLCIERSLEMVIGLLGILKAGAVYVPLDPDYPASRLEYMIRDAGVRWILTQRRFRMGEWTTNRIDLDGDWDRIANRPQNNPDGDRVEEQNLAYVIYTSGSTGKPKGVMNSHGGILNRLLWMMEQFDLRHDERILHKTSFSFDVSLWEIFWPLTAGACLVMAKPGGHRDSSYLARLIARERITNMHFVPAMLQVFLQENEWESCTSLERVMCSGEALQLELQNEFFRRSGCELHNFYGPTEAAVEVTWWVCERSTARGTVPIGKPIANTKVHVLDEFLEPAPIGIAGELYIGGVQLARGYATKPDLTAERFIPDPFDEQGDGRLYRTGDSVRYSADGNIEYLGRIDHQVKIRGFRIEPGEVEAALIAEAGVQQAAVAIQEDQRGEKCLVAYVVSAEETTSEQLRVALRRRLPEYMVPSAFLRLQTLPLTPSGKIDRQALPAAGFEPGMVGDSRVEPTPVEQILAGIWCDLLKLEQVGITDRFFELGGHSLAATQVISRIRAVFGSELPLQTLFEEPTIAGLARRIEESLRQGPRAETPSITPVSRTTPLHLSFNQQRLWFLHQMDPESSVYNCPAAVRIVGFLSLGALRQSLTAVVGRHEVLRTTFPSCNGSPIQQIQPAGAIDLCCIDLSVLRKDTQERELQRLTAAEAIRPFDLARGPVARFHLLHCGPEDHTLLLNVHHIATDGWSVGIFVRETVALYEAYCESRPSPLEDMKLQYADFAAWQLEWLRGELLAEQLQYWRMQLKGIERLELPTDHARRERPGNEGETLAFALPAGMTEKVKKLGQREGMTMFMILLPVFQIVLGHRAGHTDVVVGTDIANRNRAQTEGLIGFFVNQMALRADLSGDSDFRTLMRHGRKLVLAACEHQDLPFEKLVEELAPIRKLSLSPLFQAKFVFQNTPQVTPAVQGLEISCSPTHQKIAKFDLTLTMQEEQKTLTGTLNYRTELFRPETLVLLKDQFLGVLSAVLNDPESRLRRLQEMLDSICAGFNSERELRIEQKFNQRIRSGKRKLVERYTV